VRSEVEVAEFAALHGARLVTADLQELIGRARALVPGRFEGRSAYLASVGDPSWRFPG